MYDFHNRDISWLSFNYRVLEEAKDPSNPLYERIKFLAIYSNNLEEFYRVRVSYYRDMMRNLDSDDEKLRQVRPDKIVKRINAIVSRNQAEFEALFTRELIPQLAENGISVVNDLSDLTDEQIDFAEDYFNNNILPNLQPVILNNKRVRPFLKSGHLYVVIRLQIPPGQRFSYGLIKLPIENLISRFIEVPSGDGKHTILFTENLTMYFAHVIYPGYTIEDWYIIKLTRDADVELEDFEGLELIRNVNSLSKSRQLGEPNRFQYDRSMPRTMLKYLCRAMDITDEDLVAGGKHQNFRDFFGFPNPLSPELELPKHIPLSVCELEKAPDIFSVLRKKEYLLHFPYQSYMPFIKFLQQAAIDPLVTEIKATQYRVAANSAVVESFIRAANNGKKVTVFVELKARFDEETNLLYAQEMKAAGVNIIFSIAGMKVHSKVAMVVRETANVTERFCFLGTGNFNEKTAKLYADHGLFSAEPDIAADIERIFEYLCSPTRVPEFHSLLVSSSNMVDAFTKLILQEIANAKQGKKAYILLKINGLEDPAMINLLYRASLAGVKVDILVRGICCLIVGQRYSQNIRTIRIVDSFLEHARVYHFHADGQKTTYLGSADWMRRNLYKRIECAFPIRCNKMIEEILDLYHFQLNDNVKASLINEKMKNVRLHNNLPPLRSQHAMMEYLRNKYDK